MAAKKKAARKTPAKRTSTRTRVSPQVADVPKQRGIFERKEHETYVPHEPKGGQ